MNTFKFGTFVDGEYFTDRQKELKILKAHLDSENHIILISPRRYGKSSLVRKCLNETGRPYVWLDLQYVLSTQHFTEQLLKAILNTFTYERMKFELRRFRILPMLTNNPVTNEWSVSFQPSADKSVLLEDVLALLEKISTPRKRLVVIFDEFQEVRNIDKNLDRQLRSIMQLQQGLNYLFMGSQESMMTEIFERKKSPFYHFGLLMTLDKIPYDDFYHFVFDRLPAVRFRDELTQQILDFTQCHPYYTQQLASVVWEKISYENLQTDILSKSIAAIVQLHNMDYERLWNGFNFTDRAVLLQLSKKDNPLQNREMATSTTFSSLKRLVQKGFVVRIHSTYEIEDPFFSEWLRGI